MKYNHWSDGSWSNVGDQTRKRVMVNSMINFLQHRMHLTRWSERRAIVLYASRYDMQFDIAYFSWKVVPKQTPTNAIAKFTALNDSTKSPVSHPLDGRCTWMKLLANGVLKLESEDSYFHSFHRLSAKWLTPLRLGATTDLSINCSRLHHLIQSWYIKNLPGQLT